MTGSSCRSPYEIRKLELFRLVEKGTVSCRSPYEILGKSKSKTEKQISCRSPYEILYSLRGDTYSHLSCRSPYEIPNIYEQLEKEYHEVAVLLMRFFVPPL